MDCGDFRFISIPKTNHPSRFNRSTAFLPNRASPFIYGDVIGMLFTNVKRLSGATLPRTTFNHDIKNADFPQNDFEE